MHDYGYDLNKLLSKAEEQGDSTMENFLLQMDGLISSGEATTEKIMNNVIEFLYSLTD